MKTLTIFLAAALLCASAPAAKAGVMADLKGKLMKMLNKEEAAKPAAPAAAAETAPAAAQTAAVPAVPAQAPAAPATAAPAVEKPAAQPDAKNSKTLALHKISREEIGREAVCPATGAKVIVAANTPALELKGKTYYFSSSAVMEKFGKDPGKALAEKAKGLFRKK